MALMLSLPLAAGTLRVGLLADGGLEDYASGLLDRLFTLMPRVGRLEVVNYNRHQEAEARRQASAVHEAYAAEREVRVTTPASYVPYYESSPVYEIVPLSARLPRQPTRQSGRARGLALHRRTAESDLLIALRPRLARWAERTGPRGDGIILRALAVRPGFFCLPLVAAAGRTGQ